MEINVWTAGLMTSIMLFQVTFIPALILKKNDLADVLWGPAFVISAIAATHWGTNAGLSSLNSRSILIISILAAWALRLFLHVGWRNLTHKAEDVRYNNWRKSWGRHWLLRTYLQVFVLQALILYVFLTPILFAISSSNASLTWITGFGALIAVSGFIFESVADEQLRRFKQKLENKGRLMTEGIWAWSRHPNYFGEVLMWWGIWLMVLDIPWGWLTIVSPLGVTYLILKVSGVSMLEELMKARPGYSEYAARTSSFIPLPPKKVTLSEKNS